MRLARRLAVAALPVAAASLAAQQPAPPTQAPAVPAPVPPPWRFGLELGVTDISGNRNLRLYQGAFAVEHQRRDLFIFNGKLETRYGESNGDKAVDNAALRFRFDWRPRNAISPYAGFDIERDPIRRFDMRVTGGLGTNVNVVSRDDRRTQFSIGSSIEYEERVAGVQPNRVDELRLDTRFAFFSALTAGVTLDMNLRARPATHDLRDYLASADASVRAAFSRTFALRTRFEWRRDSRPAPGVASIDDRTLTVALAISW